MRRVKGCPSTSMNDVQLNTTTFIRHAARTYPEQEVVYRTSAGLQRYTYADAYRRMMRLANALESLGVQPGERVGVLDWNTHRHFELYFAIPGTGAALLQMNLRISTEDLTYVATHSEVSYIFVDESLLPIAEAIAPNLKNVKGYVVMSDRPVGEIKTTLGPVHGYEELLAEADDVYDWPEVDENSAYSACYTSGTTGRPKGVYYSHRNIYLHSITMAAYLGISSDDCACLIVPMFHGQSWGLFYACAMMGAKLVFPGRYTAEDTKPLVDLMIQEKATIACGAPAIFQPMLQYIRTLPDKPDFSRARFLSGATEPPLSMMRGFKELTGAEIIHAYGATETTPLVALNYRLKPSLAGLTEEERWDLKRKQGLLVTGVDVRVVGADGEEVPHDGVSVGEVCMRGPWIAGRYYNAPGTEGNFLDGYWRSGDAATIDQNGYLKIVDRIKDVIKSGGEWISSIDMENAIIGHPDVLDAAVVGLPHAKWQERPLALVIRREGGTVTDDDIRTLLLDSGFARWQLPDQIRFVSEIPKTSVGKTSKKTIVAQYRNLYDPSAGDE